MAGRVPSSTFADVAERVAPRLLRIGTRMCRSRDEAEDLVQDTLLQGFRKWDQFEGRSDPATWLYTIAGRLCQRRHRRRAGEPTRLEPLAALLPSPSDPVLDLAAPEGTPLDEHLRRSAERAVSAALARLPHAVRLPLVLADIAELSTREIARILGLKENTVKTRIHRARLRLRRALLETSALPVRDAPASDHARQVCLDLLEAKQNALDRRAPFAVSSGELCVRCRSVFEALDLAQEACARLGRGDLPPAIRRLIRARHAQEPEPGPA